jgi:hypothetical protein
VTAPVGTSTLAALDCDDPFSCIVSVTECVDGSTFEW